MAYATERQRESASTASDDRATGPVQRQVGSSLVGSLPYGQEASAPGTGGQDQVQRLAAWPGQPEDGETCERFPETRRATVTADRANVRSSSDDTDRSNIIGQLRRGEPVDVIGQEGDWLVVTYNGATGYVRCDGVTETFVQPNTCEEPLEGTEGGQSTVPGPLVGTGQGGAADQQISTDTTTNPVLGLVQDFDNVPLWNKDEAPPAQTAATHFQTPYVLATVAECDEAARIRRLVIAEGRPHAGQTVADAVGTRPFVGKATPDQVGIVAQAVVDNEFDGQTPASMQAYINQGRIRSGSRRNGKWGVDCSGFAGQMMNQLEGNGREGYEVTNAASFRVGGSRGYPPVNPQQAHMGDVISYEGTNHVVVIFDKWDVQIPMTGGDAARTKPAVKLGVGESTASQNAENGRFVRDDRRFFFFPGATTVMGQSNPDGPTYRLASNFSDELPSWQPQLSQARYAGGDAWVGTYTLNCSSDRNGTNIRVRETTGRFTTTAQRIANGASGVELKEVQGTMVRVRFNGVDTIEGKETWVPVAYVATSGDRFTIPSAGQPSGLSAGLYSVVRNPNLATPQAPQPGAQPADQQQTPGATAP